jgi:hypothetical protein
MNWDILLPHIGLTLPFVLGFAVVIRVLTVAIAAMVAMWHPRPSRRTAALKVLALLVDTHRRWLRSARHDRDPP